MELFAHDRRVLSTKIQQEELLTAGKKKPKENCKNADDHDRYDFHGNHRSS